MTIRCAQCDQPLKEGQEVEGLFAAYFHEIPSTQAYAITKPHEILVDTLAHRDCTEVE